MIIDNTSVCIKCGKQRIVIATHEEKTGSGTVVYKETACPDSDCQKKVEKILAFEFEKRRQSSENQKQRIADKKSAKGRLIKVV